MSINLLSINNETKYEMGVSPPKILEMEVLPCPECEGRLVLLLSKYGFFYGCINYPYCRATHEAHRNGKPMGEPADKTTRYWRVKAHRVFDQLYQGSNPLMTRDEAYAYLERLMKLPEEKAHISNFDVAQCQDLIDLLNFDEPIQEWSSYEDHIN